MTETIVNHTISFGGYSSNRKSCPYCSDTVQNCLCDLFKRINDGRLQYNAALRDSVLKIISNRSIEPSQNKASVIILQDFQLETESCASSTTAVNSPDLVSKEREEFPAEILGETFNTGGILTEPANIQNEEISVELGIPATVPKGNGGKVKCRTVSKGWCERLFGDYCPVWLRKIKVIDYSSEEYRKTQTTLAVGKHIEQDGKFIQKLVYRPDNRRVRWYLRPFNIQRDYSYSAICEMASNSTRPRKPYHSGIQRAPRKHLIRRWLNWRWEWETIIDFIYEDFGYIEGENNMDLLEGVHRDEVIPQIIEDYSVKKPELQSYLSSEYTNDTVTEDYGRFNSRGSSLIEEVFGGLIAVCNGEHTQLVSRIKNLRRYASV